MVYAMNWQHSTCHDIMAWHYACYIEIGWHNKKYGCLQEGKPEFKKNDGDVLKIVSEANEGRIWHSAVLTEFTDMAPGGAFRVPPNSLIQLKVRQQMMHINHTYHAEYHAILS